MERRLIMERKRPSPASIFISALGCSGRCGEPNEKILVGQSHFPNISVVGQKDRLFSPFFCGEDGDTEQSMPALK